MTTDVLLYGSGSHGHIDDHSSIRTERTEDDSLQIEMGTNAQCCIYLVCFVSRKNKGLEVWPTINKAIIFSDSVPADCLVKVYNKPGRYRSRDHV